MQLHETKIDGAFFEVKSCRLKDIGTKLFPSLCFREDGMTQGARAVAALVCIPNFKPMFTPDVLR